MDQYPEPLRRWAEELERQDPLDQVRSFLRSYFGDAESFEEIETELRSLATVSTHGIARDLRSFEAVLSQPLEPGLATRLVAWDANWVLDDPNDENSIEFLHKVADMLRAVLASAKSA
jgi:hypothetical protein